MALSFNKRIRGTVGLDLDGSYLAAVQTSGARIERAVSVDLSPGLVSEGEVVDGAALADALRAFFKANDLPRTVRLGVSNQQVAVRSLELPKIKDDAERATAVRFQASETIAMPLD